MPWQVDPPPLLSDENANALGKWAEQQLQRLAAAFENPDITAYNVLHVAPAAPREGQQVIADGTDWNPGNGAGQYIYLGGAWQYMRTGAEPNSYGTITDGTTPAPADAAGDTFKLRAANGVKVTTQNDDVTHGDNALIEMNIGGMSSVAPALGDKLPFGDVSSSDAPSRTTIQLLLDLIGSLTTDAAPDPSADFLAEFDVSAGVAKKVAFSSFQGLRKLLSTTATTSGNSVNISVPSGYQDLLIYINGTSMTAGSTMSVKFSEDGGSTFLNQSHVLGSDVGNGGNSHSVLNGATGGASREIYVQMSLRNYLSSGNKASLEVGFIGDSSNGVAGWGGGRIIISTGAINFINFLTNGTFDAGAIELWGIT